MAPSSFSRSTERGRGLSNLSLPVHHEVVFIPAASHEEVLALGIPLFGGPAPKTVGMNSVSLSYPGTSSSIATLANQK